MQSHLKALAFSLLICPVMIGATLAADAENGKKIFNNTGKSSNGLACSTCHDLAEASADGLLRPAHPLTNVLGRPSFWSDTLKTFQEAADFCAAKFMQIEGLSPADKADLESFAATLGKEAQPALVLAKRTRKGVGDVGKLTGDVARGKDLAEKTCIQCHGKKGPGPVLNETLSPAPIIMVVLSTGGKMMPFFSTDRLNDQQVADLAAYVSSINRSSK